MVDPLVPLPTIGQIVTDAPGSTTGVPDSIGPNDTGSSTRSIVGDGGPESTTSTTAQGSAVQNLPSVLNLISGSVTGCLLGLVTVGLAIVLYL